MNVFTGEMSAEQTRMNELYTTLKAWSDAYYNDDAPLATDEEYDRLMRELKQLEAEHPYWVAEDSPTQNVGGKRVMGIPVEHRVPMLSLEDVFERGSVRDFVDAVQKEYPETTFSVERKIDGLSLSLVYEDGKLVQASTRGDGRVGEDVTANVMALPSVPKKFELPRGGENNEPLFHHIELRGECYMGEEDFLAANAEQRVAGKKPYMNPRNCAAGTLRQSDPAIAKSAICRCSSSTCRRSMETSATIVRKWLSWKRAASKRPAFSTLSTQMRPSTPLTASDTAGTRWPTPLTARS